MKRSYATMKQTAREHLEMIPRQELARATAEMLGCAKAKLLGS